MRRLLHRIGEWLVAATTPPHQRERPRPPAELGTYETRTTDPSAEAGGPSKTPPREPAELGIPPTEITAASPSAEAGGSSPARVLSNELPVEDPLADEWAELPPPPRRLPGLPPTVGRSEPPTLEVPEQSAPVPAQPDFRSALAAVRRAQGAEAARARRLSPGPPAALAGAPGQGGQNVPRPTAGQAQAPATAAPPEPDLAAIRARVLQQAAPEPEEPSLAELADVDPDELAWIDAALEGGPGVELADGAALEEPANGVSLGTGRNTLEQTVEPAAKRLKREAQERAERRARVAELSAAGLSVRQIAEQVGTSPTTVHRDIRAQEGERSKQLAIRADEREAVLQRFMSKVEKSDEHWLWIGAKWGDGYGQFSLRGVQKRAHRVAYVLFYGPIPAGLLVRHLCNVPLCMNPEHLALGTDEDNQRDRVEADRQAKGETIGCAKLWQLEAEHIKRRALDGESPTRLAREFGVDPKAVRLIRDGVNWKHIEQTENISPPAPPEVESLFGRLFSSREARDDAWGRLVGNVNSG